MLGHKKQKIEAALSAASIFCFLICPKASGYSYKFTSGLLSVLSNHFPELNSQQVLTVGDSPNDEAMFEPALFPISVGVANIRHYQNKMVNLPKYVTRSPEFAGFQELAQLLLKDTVTDDSM